MLDIIACDICRAPFMPSNKQAKRCSAACRKAAKQRWQRDKQGVDAARIPGTPMQCARCGIPLIRRGPSHTYCSPCKKLVNKAIFRRSAGAAPWDVLGATFACVRCGTEAIRTGPRQKYCSDTCYAIVDRERQQRKLGRTRLAGTWFLCAVCGAQAQRKRGGNRCYCSLSCRKTYQLARKRERNGYTNVIGALFACAICDTLSPRLMGGQIYCSHDCNHLAAYRRRARWSTDQRGMPYTRRSIFERDQWRCQSCWKRVQDNVPLRHPSRSTIDHIVPLSRGGKECASNVHTLCWPCNHAKGPRVGRNDQLRLAL